MSTLQQSYWILSFVPTSLKATHHEESLLPSVVTKMYTGYILAQKSIICYQVCLVLGKLDKIFKKNFKALKSCLFSYPQHSDDNFKYENQNTTETSCTPLYYLSYNQAGCRLIPYPLQIFSHKNEHFHMHFLNTGSQRTLMKQPNKTSESGRKSYTSKPRPKPKSLK